MRSRFVSLVVMMFLLLPWLGATASSAPAPSYSEIGFDPHMLNASAPTRDRLDRFDALMKQANSGQVRAQDLAGTLFWQGPAIEGSPVPRNLAQARNLLANAAVNGEVMAMAKLAELELGAGRTNQAMVWAQMYARYRDPTTSVRSRSRRQSSYTSGLITRILKAGGAIDKTTKSEVASMVARFDNSIRRGIDEFSALRRSGSTYLFRYPSGRDKREDVNVSGFAEYMIEFDPDGKPTRMWLLDSVPTARVDTVVRPYLDLALANKVSSDTGPRYLKIPIIHSAVKYKTLRPTH